MASLLTVAAILVAYAAFSKPLAARGVTSAMVFTTAGFLVGSSALGLVDITVESSVAELVTEVALVLLLFSDAVRIDLHSLRRQLAWPSRLLLIGLPLYLLVGTGVGMLVLPGTVVLTAFLLATILAATDAALGQRVVTDPSVPARVRQALDVESGLNDGLAVPFFLVAVDVSRAELTTGVTSAVVWSIAEQIGWGLFAGAVIGVLGGALLRVAIGRDWVEGLWRPVLPLAAALLAFAVADSLGGSGFIAAFSGGLVFGHVSRQHGLRITYLTEESGEVLAAVTWIGFGAIAVTWVLPHITWQIVLYAVVSLTVVRMACVAIALARHGPRLPTVAFIGWFGPRGLASIVFALIALESEVPEWTTIITAVVVTVALSVFAHGLTAVPLVRAYRRWYDTHTAERPDAVEAAPAAMSRLRRRPTAEEAALVSHHVAPAGAGDSRPQG